MKDFKDEILLWLHVVLIMLIMTPVIVYVVCRDFIRVCDGDGSWVRERNWGTNAQRRHPHQVEQTEVHIEAKVDWKHEGF